VRFLNSVEVIESAESKAQDDSLIDKLILKQDVLHLKSCRKQKQFESNDAHKQYASWEENRKRVLGIVHHGAYLRKFTRSFGSHMRYFRIVDEELLCWYKNAPKEKHSVGSKTDPHRCRQTCNIFCSFNFLSPLLHSCSLKKNSILSQHLFSKFTMVL
jgi:hypothetical protein